jgi:hypothetical protein
MKTYKVNNLEITEEEVKRLAIEAGLIKEEKPLNRLYVSHDKLALIWFTDNREGFGFDRHEDWTVLGDNCISLSDKWWTLATDEYQQQWNKLLIQHAESKGYTNDNHKCLNRDNKIKGTNNFITYDGNVFRLNLNGSYTTKVFNGSTGEWATIIEKVSVQEEWDKLTPENKMSVLRRSFRSICGSDDHILNVISSKMELDNIDNKEKFTIR